MPFYDFSTTKMTLYLVRVIKSRIFCLITSIVLLVTSTLKVTVLPTTVDLQLFFQPLDQGKHIFNRPITVEILTDSVSLFSLTNNIKKFRLSSSLFTQVVNCRKLFADDQNEIDRAKTYVAALRDRSTMSLKSSNAFAYFNNVTSNCRDFLYRRAYMTFPTSEEELDFPIAFSIMMYKNVQQFERLLRAIYRPNNYYCVHVDFKIDDDDFRAVRSITDCLPNAFLASKRYNVYWGHISLLYAELTCMRNLLKYSWRYLINLSGQMYPLHSNKFIVQFAKSLNGTNDIEAVP